MMLLLQLICTSWELLFSSLAGLRGAIKGHRQKKPSLDFEDEIGAVEITASQVFPIDRLKKLQSHMITIQQPESYFMEDKEFNVVDKLFPIFLARWVKDEQDSFLAFKGMTHILKGCLLLSSTDPGLFHKMMVTGGKDSVRFLAAVIPYIIDSEMVQGTNAVDLLLTNLAVIAVKTGQNFLMDFIRAVPFFSGFFLGVHRKQFEELHMHIFRESNINWNDLHEPVAEINPHYLRSMHLPARKIIVSNAPPVKLHRSAVFRKQRKYSCEVSAGGLVSGIKPSLDQTDIWISYLDPCLLGLDRMPQQLPGKIFKESLRIPARYRRAPSLNMDSPNNSHDVYDQIEDFLWEKAENDFLSLQERLRTFSEQNFQVNPLVILKDDHKAYYNGVSNGLLWPGFHNLPEYIINDYVVDDQALADDWLKYIKVNFHFAIHTARNSRRQDFIWIHDYHLMLCGLMFRSLDPSLNCCFFLHIPFAVSDDFMNKFHNQGLAIIKGLLGFKRVGFQTRRDCDNFVRLVRKHVPEAEVTEKVNIPELFGYTVNVSSWITDIGTFPISIKVDTVLKIASHEAMSTKVEVLRNKLLVSSLARSDADLKVFLSVERFDYTKGIFERIAAIEKYFEINPDAVGKHIFYQIAASSRADVKTYKEYQRKCISSIDSVNTKYQQKAMINDMLRSWLPIVIDSKNVPFDEVVALFKACDVIVVTPIIDGMNLVIKEGVLCNPSASFVFSSGAGATRQFQDAGLSSCYHLVEEISNPGSFAEVLVNAVHDEASDSRSRGARMYDFVMQHDIEHWISSFLSPIWTHDVTDVTANLDTCTKGDISFIRKLQLKRSAILHQMLNAQYISDVDEAALNNALAVAQGLRKNGSILSFCNDGQNFNLSAIDLINGLRLDVAFLEHFRAAEDSMVMRSIIEHEFEISESDFLNAVSNLSERFQNLGYFDTLLLDFEAFYGSQRDDEVNLELSLCSIASLTAACLVTLFASRKGAKINILNTNIGISENLGCLPFDHEYQVNEEAMVSVLAENLLAEKKVLVIASRSVLVKLNRTIGDSANDILVIEVCDSGQMNSKTNNDTSLNVTRLVCSRASCYAAMASCIEKSICINLQRAE